MIMLICIKQHLSIIFRSGYEKVKQHWDWVEKKQACNSIFIIFYFNLTIWFSYLKTWVDAPWAGAYFCFLFFNFKKEK